MKRGFPVFIHLLYANLEVCNYWIKSILKIKLQPFQPKCFAFIFTLIRCYICHNCLIFYWPLSLTITQFPFPLLLGQSANRKVCRLSIAAQYSRKGRAIKGVTAAAVLPLCDWWEEGIGQLNSYWLPPKRQSNILAMNLIFRDNKKDSWSFLNAFAHCRILIVKFMILQMNFKQS